MNILKSFLEKFANMDMSRVLIGAIMVSAAYWYYVYDDGTTLEREIATAQAQLQEETTKKAKTEAALKELNRMKQAVVSLGETYRKIIRQLPAELNSLEINRTLDDHAKAAGISIRSRVPMATVKGPIYQEEPVKVEVEGTYSQIAQFIYLVSKSEKLAATKEILLNRDETKEEGPLKFEATISNYRLTPAPTSEEKAELDKKASGATQ